MDIFFALLSALTTAVYFVYVSQTMKARPGLSSTLTLAVSHLGAAMFLLPAWHLTAHPDFSTESHAWFLVMVTAGLLVVSRQLYFYAYARTDVANITVFSALTPVYTLFTAYFLLREIPTLPELGGMALICGSVYVFFLQPKPGTRFWRAASQPFRHIVQSRPVLFAFLSTIPTAFAAVFQKHSLTYFNPSAFSFLLLLMIGSAAMLIALVLFRPVEIKRQLTLLPLRFFVISSLLLAVMHVAFCVVMFYHQTAVSLVLQRSSLVFQILLAYIYLRERQHIGKRMTVAFCIVAGFVLIILG